MEKNTNLADHINIVEFTRNNRFAKCGGIYQYDRGQILRIKGLNLPKAVEVQYAYTESGGSTETRVGTTADEVTDVYIPNEMLKNNGITRDYSIWAFVYVTDGNSGNTVYKMRLDVTSRPAPGECSEDPDESHILDEAVNAVNAAADRAEQAVADAAEIRDKLNVDVSEKVTRPEKAEVGQVLTVKETDESGKPTVFEAQDIKVPTKTSELENDSGFLTEHQDISGKLDAEKLPEAIDSALAQAKKNGVFDGKDGAPGDPGPKGDPGEITYIENPYDDTDIKKGVDDIKQAFEDAVEVTVENKIPLWTPENAEVGQILRVQSVNEDGSVVLETVSGGVTDVLINGESVVEDGVVEMPIASRTQFGVVIGNGQGVQISNSGNVFSQYASPAMIDHRNYYYQCVTPKFLDYAVKAAMCDGKGDAWSTAEQAAARERMGINDWEDITDITLEETCPIDISLNGNFKDLYIYVSQDNASEKIIGTTYLYPYNAEGENVFFSYYPPTNASFLNIGSIWHYDKQLTQRYAYASNAQKESTGNFTCSLKMWDADSTTKKYPDTPFTGIKSSPTYFKVGTRIVVKGIRA